MKNYFKNSSKSIYKLEKFFLILDKISKELLNARKKKKNIAIIGNGGSNAMAEHFASELSCTFKKSNRKPFRALTFNNLSSMSIIGLYFFKELIFSFNFLSNKTIAIINIAIIT